MGTSDVDRIISGREVREMVSYSLMQIWRLERNGQFPKRIKLGPGRVGWHPSPRKPSRSAWNPHVG